MAKKKSGKKSGSGKHTTAWVIGGVAVGAGAALVAGYFLFRDDKATKSNENALPPGTTGVTPAPAPRPPASTPSNGLTASQIRNYQAELAALGFNVAADGKLGNQTAAAVRAFQTTNGLPVNGTLDAATRNSIAVAYEHYLVDTEQPDIQMDA